MVHKNFLIFFYVSSYYKTLLKVKKNIPTEWYNDIKTYMKEIKTLHAYSIYAFISYQNEISNLFKLIKG